MARRTGIEWATATWNPWRGCTKVSVGCKNCYMFRDQKRFGHDPNKIVRSKTTFHDPEKWKEPERIFVCSWSDFAHEGVPMTWVLDAWNIMRTVTQHKYLLLTKRPHQLIKLLPDDWGEGWDHVAVGVTLENGKYWDRMVWLRDIPAKIKFISAEPLLGWLSTLYLWFTVVDWVIVGGESGPGFRPMDEAWVRDIQRQCEIAGIPFFFKQWGGARKSKDGTWGGDFLDGVRYHEFPEEVVIV